MTGRDTDQTTAAKGSDPFVKTDDVALDLGPGFSPAQLSDPALTILVEGVPDGARLSAGTNNGDKSWSLAPGDLNGLRYTPPPARKFNVLTVRAVRRDVEEANTIASFDVDVPVMTAVAGETDRQPEAAVAEGRKQEAARLAQARLEWEREEAGHLTLARKQWEAEAEQLLGAARDRWTVEAEERLARLDVAAEARHESRLAKARAKWESAAREKMAAAEAEWTLATERALAELEARWQAQNERKKTTRHEPQCEVAASLQAASQ